MLVSSNVFAQEENLTDSEVIDFEQSEFEKVIEEILQIQKSNPTITEEEILVIMDDPIILKRPEGLAIFGTLLQMLKRNCVFVIHLLH